LYLVLHEGLGFNIEIDVNGLVMADRYTGPFHLEMEAVDGAHCHRGLDVVFCQSPSAIYILVPALLTVSSLKNRVRLRNICTPPEPHKINIITKCSNFSKVPVFDSDVKNRTRSRSKSSRRREYQRLSQSNTAPELSPHSAILYT
jgi:hypothetical protein